MHEQGVKAEMLLVSVPSTAGQETPVLKEGRRPLVKSKKQTCLANSW